MRPMRSIRRPQAQTLQSVSLPAPTGGMNTVAPGNALPLTQCILSRNLVPGEYGLRTRPGTIEWVTGCTGAANDEMRSGIPYHGSSSAGDKLFWTTSEGIWPASTSDDTPAITTTFGTQTGDAGFGISHAAKTIAGHFLLHCDEVNGLYLYTESSSTWAKVALGYVPWVGSTAYLVGDMVTNGADVYVCDTSGTAAASGGPTGSGTNIVDGTARWDYVGAAASSPSLYASLADQRNGFDADPANMVFVSEWKGRMLLVERDTSVFWYLEGGTVSGLATRFDMGRKFQHGGSLVGVYTWSYDGGSGMDSLLVGISTGGDVAIYQGTDPASANTFGIKGSWYVGGVPYGRRIATDSGGEMLILSNLGLVPLSKLVAGASIEDRALYATKDIANLFNYYVSTRRSLRGWGIYVHPSENVLLVSVPTADGQACMQLAMSFATGAWGWWDVPLLSACAWNGNLYYGTTDGKVGINTGDVDGVTLLDPDAFTPIPYSLITAYSDLGTANQKRVQMIRPTVLSQTPNAAVRCTARYDFNLMEGDLPSSGSVGAEDVFGTAEWDVATWAGDYSPTQPLKGGMGVGRDVAIAIRGTAISRTVLVKVDVHFDVGGVL